MGSFTQTRDDTMRQITAYIDPSLAFVNYEEVSYASDCSLSKETLLHSCFDLFALAHFLGWFVKTLICRDVKLIMFESILFEVVEYSLRDVLNNFKECWWDHLIVDFLGCNMLGIIAGFYVIDRFGLDRYRWSLRTAPMPYSHWQNFKRFAWAWDLSYLETKVFASLKHFLKISLLAIMVLPLRLSLS
jgi:hypothetical protein